MMAYMAVGSAHQILENQAQTRLTSIANAKRLSLKSSLDALRTSVVSQSNSPVFRGALTAFVGAFEAIPGDKFDHLRQRFVIDNEHPKGEKHFLDFAEGRDGYNRAHRKFHPYLRSLVEKNGYADLYLVDEYGNVLFSVMKHEDYAIRISDEGIAETGLTRIFADLINGGNASPFVFEDFSEYELAQSTSSAFMGTPIQASNGAILGVLIVRFEKEAIRVTDDSLAGLGETGVVYAIGDNRALRALSGNASEQAFIIDENAVGPVASALSGASGVVETTTFSGTPALAAYLPMQFAGTSWAVVAEQENRELFADISTLLKSTVTNGAILMLFSAVIGILFAKSITRPLLSVRDVMLNVARGELSSDVPETDRLDEIGDLSRALDTMRSDLQSADAELIARNREQETASKEMAEMAADREKAALREVEIAKEKEASDRETAQAREAMMIDLGKSFGTVVEAAIGGEFSNRVEAKFSDQILNQLAENINQLLGAVDQGLSETGQVLERVADGDLTKGMEGDFRGAFGHLQGNVNNMIDGLKSLIIEISGSGSTLAESSAELRDTSGVLSNRAEQNAASLEEASAALEELSASIKQVGGNVADVSKDAQAARDTAQSSEKVAADAAASMDRIAAASKEIAGVVTVINDIAFQINLLALNAGVEAARAGEAGRGFAVVASEVRQLSQRAAEASNEISTVITKSDTAVYEGVENVSRAQSSLEEITVSVVSISAEVNEISNTIAEQVGGVGEITVAISQIDQSTQKQAASFEEVTAASGLLANEADGLKLSTARFRTGEEANVLELKRPAPIKAMPKERPKIVATGGGSVTKEGWEEF
ncbi:methyl-accepting chemotaxis protein [Ascidiaceihabitans sp.]|uniref:methyl-accepting chemotaxis protein n=2 Tax=Ascidiaceihabitans sp. TaxID=1872644 RepID=UPI003299A4CA